MSINLKTRRFKQDAEQTNTISLLYTEAMSDFLRMILLYTLYVLLPIIKATCNSCVCVYTQSNLSPL